MTGRSLIKLLESKQSGRIDASRDATYAGRERHSSSRWNNLGYPQRCIRTERFLYIRNFRPHRWPAGAPQKLVSLEGHQTLGPMHAAYHDIDASPTLALLADKAELPAFAKYLQLAVQKRPAEELYDVMADPACLYNLADQPELADTKQRHSERLEQFLLETRDPRIVDGGEIFESYRRYSPLREFPEPD